MEGLRYSAEDAYEAALMAEALEANGIRVMKTGGYYRDEATVYRAEMRRRSGSKEAKQ
jgi:hypothetical protein